MDAHNTARMGKLQQALLACDAAIFRGTTQSAIFDNVCRPLVEIAGYPLVWIGMRDTDDARIWPQAHAGEGWDYLNWVQWIAQVQNTPHYGLAGLAVEQRSTLWTHDLPNDERQRELADTARAAHWQAAVAIPLKCGEPVVGVLCIVARLPQMLDEVARDLLQQLADNIGRMLARLAHEEARKQSEYALMESEVRYNALFASNCLPLLVVDPGDGRIVDANIRAVDFYGWDTATLIGMNLDAIDTMDAGQTRNAMANAAAAQRPYYESRHKLRSGEVRDVEVFHSTLSFGGQHHIILAIHDVTERRRLTTELHRTQSLVQQFIDQLPGTAFLKDDRGRLVMANRMLGATLGVDPHSVIGKTVHDIFPRDFADYVSNLDRQVLQEGQPRTFHETFEDRHNETNLFVVQHDDGGRYLGGVSFDVTDRERARARASALLHINEMAGQVPERDFLTAGLELAQEVTSSKIGFLHFVNEDQETLELVTWTAGALKGCTAAYDQHYPVSQAGIWADCLRTGGPVVFNDYASYPAKRGLPEGHATLTRLISVPVIEHGKVWMMLGVGNKVTDYSDFDVDTLRLIGNDLWRIARRARLEQALTERVKELEAANEKLAAMQMQLVQSEKMASIGHLASGVAHEINNPIGFVKSNLGSLKGYMTSLAEILGAYDTLRQVEPAALAGCLAEIETRKAALDYAFLVEDVGKLIDESIDGVQRVGKIVLDLKSFSRSGDTTMAPSDLEAGIESTINVVWNQLKYKVELKREYQPLPPVVCIASQINQVIMNLLVNAEQAITERGTITVRTGSDGAVVWFEVQDSGCGMDEATRKRIFEPFYTTKPVGKGTGLGLSISLSIVQRHHGRLDVQSAPGQGSTFRVTLPLDASKA